MNSKLEGILFGQTSDAKLIQLARPKIAKICKCDAVDIEDIFPFSSIQEEIANPGARNPEYLITQTVFPLPAGVDLCRFQRAWENVTRSAPIIRTRIVDTKVGLEDIVVSYDHAFSLVIFAGKVPLSTPTLISA